jgi:hypothetical protein
MNPTSEAASVLALQKVLIQYDQTLLVADPRGMESNKFGGKGACACFQKLLSPFLVDFACLCSSIYPAVIELCQLLLILALTVWKI